MAEKATEVDAEFRERAIRIITETGKAIEEVAQDLGINETGPWPRVLDTGYAAGANVVAVVSDAVS
jgi:transposase